MIFQTNKNISFRPQQKMSFALNALSDLLQFIFLIVDNYLSKSGRYLDATGIEKITK